MAGKHGSSSGVRQYLFFTKEKVSSDWKDLAFHLGFGQADIDNIADRNRDDKSRCMDLLEEWLKRNGERATIEVLMRALSESNLQSTVDGLRSEYPELQQEMKREEGDRFPWKEEEVARLKDVFQKSVKRYYELKLTDFKPLIWNDHFTLSLSAIFTQLELIKARTKSIKGPRQYRRSSSAAVGREERQKLSSLDDLFNPGVTGRSTAPRCILIEGEAGGGKTTFLSKETMDAVSQKTELGRRHDIVLLIRLREVREGETIEEMVWDQCVPETTVGVDVQSIRAILQRNESRVLFLLDGYDELRPGAKTAGQAIPKLLDGKMYPNSSIVITSRPSADVQQYTQPECHVHITGFSSEHVVKYVRQYFSIVGDVDLAEHFIRQHFTVYGRPTDVDESGGGEEEEVNFQGDNLLHSLLQTPIFLLLVCVLWEEGQEMVSTATMTELYNNLLTCLVRKYCKREGVDMPTDGLPATVADSLLQLGKLALEALLKNEALFDLAQVEKEKVDWELLLKLGLVSLEDSASKWHPRKQLNFSHKTMQEFLAGRYVAHAVVKQDIAELLQLTSISSAIELGNLLQFTCGCDSRAAQAVLDQLSCLRRKELPNLRADQFKAMGPFTRMSFEGNFVKLCLKLLSEKQEPEVLQAFIQALPIVMLGGSVESREATALKYYIQNLKSTNLPDRLILKLDGGTYAVEYLRQCFTNSLPGLKLDLELSVYDHIDIPKLTKGLVSTLHNVPSLRALDLANTGLTPSSLQPLVQGFRQVSLLEELDLTGNNALGDAGMEVLQAGLEYVPYLTVLRLKFVGLGANGMRTLAPALCHLTGLIKLDISDNIFIHNTGVKCLADILPRLTAMKVLNLSSTVIDDSGVLALVKALPHLVELQVLDLRDNHIGDLGIVSLVQTLCQLSCLDAEQNPSADKRLTTVPHYNTTLRELYIEQNEVTGAGLGKVAQIISALPALTSLDISGHWKTPAQLSDTAAMALAEALPRLPALKRLIMMHISMKPAGFQAVVQAAKEHPTLETLRYNEKLVPEGADTSASCLV